MKRFIRSLAVISIILCFAFVLTGAFGQVFATDGRYKDNGVTFLVCGLDDAAENTDVICLVNYSATNKRISVIQIPRDTYCDFNAHPNKINQYFARSKRALGSAEDAMKAFCAFVSEQLSVSVDGYIAITTDSFIRFVDSLGGVDIELQEELVLESDGKVILTLNPGVNKLSGREALTLVRHRKGYDRGDLGRLDVQKIFFEGLFKSINSCAKTNLIRGGRKLLSSSVTDISFFDVLRIFLFGRASGGCDFYAATLPGEAVIDTNGLSYYVLKRSGATSLMKEVFGPQYAVFDKNCLFLNSKNKDFKSIYYS